MDSREDGGDRAERKREAGRSREAVCSDVRWHDGRGVSSEVTTYLHVRCGEQTLCGTLSIAEHSADIRRLHTATVAAQRLIWTPTTCAMAVMGTAVSGNERCRCRLPVVL